MNSRANIEQKEPRLLGGVVPGQKQLPDIFETAGFPAKVYLCALAQHCTSNFLVQCCLRRIWATLTRQYSYAMLSQHGRHNIV